MKKGEIYEGVVERIDFPNKGRVHVEGETVTVKNAIPGQKIRFQINKKRKNRMEGRLLEVTEKSPMEKRDPVCSIFPSCGGCMYQTMSYEDQLAMKAGQVKKLLDDALVEAGQVNEAGEADYPFLGIKGSPKEFAYRNKMEFSFGDEYKDGPLSLGLHKKGSTYDVLTACDVVEEEQRFSAGACDIVHTHGNGINADGVVFIKNHGELHLGSASVCTGKQHRLFHFFDFCQGKSAGKTAKAA